MPSQAGWVGGSQQAPPWRQLWLWGKRKTTQVLPAGHTVSPHLRTISRRNQRVALTGTGDLKILEGAEVSPVKTGTRPPYREGKTTKEDRPRPRYQGQRGLGVEDILSPCARWKGSPKGGRETLKDTQWPTGATQLFKPSCYATTKGTVCLQMSDF